jgi:hypothetical protein
VDGISTWSRSSWNWQGAASWETVTRWLLTSMAPDLACGAWFGWTEKATVAGPCPPRESAMTIQLD